MTLEKPDPAKEQIKRARRVALVLATSTVISVLCLAFAFIQKTEADRLYARLMGSQARAIEALQIAEKSREEAAQQRAVAEQSQLEAVRALEECAKNKK